MGIKAGAEACFFRDSFSDLGKKSMLKNLLIENYALIEKLDISPSPQMNVITGETGAGKSILRGALGLLIGNRADTKVLLRDDKNCIIEGIFELPNADLQPLFEQEGLDFDTHCLIRRQISPGGRSRAFINDTPVSLESLRKIALRLMDIHAQHDTLQLFSNDYQLGILDIFASNQELLAAYQQKYKGYKATERKLKELKEEAARLKKEQDYHQHLLGELQNAELDTLDQEQLEQDLERLENVEFIRSQMHLAHQALAHEEYSAENILREAAHALAKTQNFSKTYQDLYERLQSVLIETKDIAQTLQAETEDLVIDEETAEVIRKILSALYNLQQKHQAPSIAQLRAIRDDLEIKVRKVENSDEEIAQLEEELTYQKGILEQIASELSQRRKEVIAPTEAQINYLLSELGIPNAVFSIQTKEIPLSATGADMVEYWFSANKGFKPQPMKDVASGGEFSRLMLAIKYQLAQKIAMPTLVFDEIDTGVSGEIALKMGKIIKELSAKHQVFIISHLPQIAAKGDLHYYVYKKDNSERTVSNIKLLTDEERVEEIAQMIGGSKPSDSTYSSAKELLKI
jgi:DNA repair protein RecN (Recombination protein N)